MENLVSLILTGSGHVPSNLLKNICAPLLSTFSITWSEDDDRSLIGPPLETFLSSSPLLRDLTLDNVIHSEASLIKILRTHSLINKLVFKTICDLPNLITDRTFRLLTFNERARILLPQLEVLLMSGGLHGVGSDVIAEFLKSRGAEWCARDLSQPQNHTGRPGPSNWSSLMTAITRFNTTGVGCGGSNPPRVFPSILLHQRLSILISRLSFNTMCFISYCSLPGDCVLTALCTVCCGILLLHSFIPC